MLNLFLFLQDAAAQLSSAGGEQSASGQPAAGGFDFSGIIMIVVLIGIFYFLMIRPRQKRQKEIQKFRESISVGDNVITAGGIYGKVDAVKDTYFILDIGDKVKIRIDKGSVYQSPESAQEAQAESSK